MEPDEANVPVCASVLCVHARLCVCCASLIVCGTNRMNSEDTETVKRRMVAEVLNGIRSGGSGDGLYMAPGVNVRARVELADVDRRGDDYIVVRIEAAGAGGSASIGEKAMVLPAQFRRRYPETSQPPVAGDIVYGAAGYDDFVGPKHRCHYRLVVLVVCQDLELQAWDVWNNWNWITARVVKDRRPDLARSWEAPVPEEAVAEFELLEDCRETKRIQDIKARAVQDSLPDFHLPGPLAAIIVEYTGDVPPTLGRHATMTVEVTTTTTTATTPTTTTTHTRTHTRAHTRTHTHAQTMQRHEDQDFVCGDTVSVQCFFDSRESGFVVESLRTSDVVKQWQLQLQFPLETVPGSPHTGLDFGCSKCGVVLIKGSDIYQLCGRRVWCLEALPTLLVATDRDPVPSKYDGAASARHCMCKQCGPDSRSLGLLFTSATGGPCLLKLAMYWKKEAHKASSRLLVVRANTEKRARDIIKSLQVV